MLQWSRSSFQVFMSCHRSHAWNTIRLLMFSRNKRQALKQHLENCQFTETFLVVVFLRTIKLYLFQVFKERNLLFQDRACVMFILLLPTSCFMSTCLSTQVTNVFKTAGVLRQLYKRGVFSHRGVISTEHGRSDLRSPVRHKTLLSPL